MQTVEELEQQKLELEKKIEEAKKAERETDLKTVKSLCTKHGFYASDLGNALKRRKKRKAAADKTASATAAS